MHRENKFFQRDLRGLLCAVLSWSFFTAIPGVGRVRAAARVCRRPRLRQEAATCAAPSTAWSSGILLQPLATISIARQKIDAAALSSTSR